MDPASSSSLAKVRRGNSRELSANYTTDMRLQTTPTQVHVSFPDMEAWSRPLTFHYISHVAQLWLSRVSSLIWQHAWRLLEWSYVCTALLHWWLCSSSKWESRTVRLQLVGHLHQLVGPRQLLEWSYVRTALLHWHLCSSSKWESRTVRLQLVGHLHQLVGPRPYQALP